MSKTTKEFAINEGKHRVYMELDPVVDEGRVVEDTWSVEAFTHLATELTALFNVVSDRSFCIEIFMSECGKEDPHCFVAIATASGDNKDGFMRIDEDRPVSRWTAVQYYMATSQNCPDANYAGKLEINVCMHCPEDGDEQYTFATKDPIAGILMDLTCMQYYKAIAKCYPGWQMSYINALTS